jgi:hypothetical protein
MAWKIVRDHTEEPGSENSAVGIGQGDLVGETQPFILYDDDGECYFEGRVDADGIDDDEEYGGLYQAFKWGMAFAGTTDLRMQGESVYA